jgi:hypothetical protein
MSVSRLVSVVRLPLDALWQRSPESGQCIILPWPRLELGSAPSGPTDNRRSFDLLSADFDLLDLWACSSFGGNFFSTSKR